MGRFKAKRKRKSTLVLFIGIFLISVSLSVKYLIQNGKVEDNTLLNHLMSFSYDNNNFYDIDFLMKYALNIELDKDNLVSSEEDDAEKLEVSMEEENNVLVYIYNTHQSEKYKSSYESGYNIEPTVLLGAKILEEYLESYGIKVLVEEADITSKLHSLGLKYGNSYEVARMFLESAYENNPTLTYFIDFHRDSSSYQKTTTSIDGKSYAKLLFVIGLDNPTYEKNLEFAENLRSKIESVNEDLFRGIMKKSGKGVNGVYNQDFHENTILIEVGGQYNNISEVNNTLKVFAKIFSDYIKEDRENEEEKE